MTDYGHGGILERAMDPDYEADPDPSDSIADRVNAGPNVGGGDGGDYDSIADRQDTRSTEERVADNLVGVDPEDVNPDGTVDLPEYDPDSSGGDSGTSGGSGGSGGAGSIGGGDAAPGDVWEPPEALEGVSIEGDPADGLDSVEIGGSFGTYEPDPEPDTGESSDESTDHGGVLDRATDDEYQADPDDGDSVADDVNAGPNVGTEPTDSSSDGGSTGTETSTETTTDEDTSMTETTAGDLFRGREGSGSPIPGVTNDLGTITVDELAALDASDTELSVPSAGDATADNEDGASITNTETGETIANLDPADLRETTQELADQYEEIQEQQPEQQQQASMQAALAEYRERLAELGNVTGGSGGSGGIVSGQVVGVIAVAALVVGAAKYSGAI